MAGLGDLVQVGVFGVLEGPDPDLHVDLDGTVADIAHLGVDADQRADSYRAQKVHAFDGDGGGTSHRLAAGGPFRGLIHQAHQPTCRDIAVGIGMLSCRGQLERQLSLWHGNVIEFCHHGGRRLVVDVVVSSWYPPGSVFLYRWCHETPRGAHV